MTSLQTLVIVRHGKPALSRKVRLTWQGYREWWTQYDAGGLAAVQNIPKAVKTHARNADFIISSPLRRARESAERVTGRAPDVLDPDLIEAALPPPHLGRLTLRPKTWGTFARISWYMGWSDGMESHKEAQVRAKRMVKTLEQHIHHHKFIFVTAHGWFNRMLKRELKKNGWSCVSQNGDLHWSHRRYIRKVPEGT